MSATDDEHGAAEPSRADPQEQLPSDEVGPAGARCWVCEQPVADVAVDYDDGGPHSYCAWKATRIERGLGGPTPATGWSDVRW